MAPYMEKCRELGVKNIHIHKGPTIHPLNLDAFDVRDVDYVATAFPDLNFIVDHCGMPRIDDFCWIAGQEPNVYGGLALIPSFIHARPKYFAQMLSDLLFFLGPDRLLFGSDYGITSPKWIVEKFMAYQFPDDLAQEAATQLTLDVKRKILGLNARRLYDLDVPAECRIPVPRQGRRRRNSAGPRRRRDRCSGLSRTPLAPLDAGGASTGGAAGPDHGRRSTP